MREIEMANFHGYHMQSDGIICKKNTRIKLEPHWNGYRFVYVLSIDGNKRKSYDAYKLFYHVFVDPEADVWADDCAVYPKNGYPLDLRAENLELINKQAVLSALTHDQIKEIKSTYHSNNKNATVNSIAKYYDVSANMVRYIVSVKLKQLK